jgi:hypothetical protein
MMRASQLLDRIDIGVGRQLKLRAPAQAEETSDLVAPGHCNHNQAVEQQARNKEGWNACKPFESMVTTLQ